MADRAAVKPGDSGPTPAPRAPVVTKPTGLGLTVKIFLGYALVVVLLVGGTLAIASVQARRVADESVTRVLGSARAAVSAQLVGRGNGMRSAATTFALNSTFRSLVGSRDLSAILDQAEVAADGLEATWVQITDDEAMRLAKSDDPGAPSLDLSGSAEIVAALRDSSATGFGVSGDSLLVQVASVPIVGTGGIVGAMLVARPLDDALAAAVKEQASAAVEIVFHLTALDGSVVVSGSTLGRNPELLTALDGLPDPDAATTMAGSWDFELGGVHYVGVAEPLRGASGAVAGGFLMLRDRDAEFAAFERFQRSLYLAGGVGVLLAALLALVLARQVTRPVSKLVVATKRATDGDYAAEITATSNDEIGVLAASFRAMLTDLREKQQLVEFLSTADQARTVRMQAVSATAQQRIADVGLTPGNRFAGRYEVKEILGEGGMGTVFKAVDGELGELIAIKTLKKDFLAQDDTALERFKTEIRLARRISHRNVVRTHDLGEHAGVYYITMEYVEGTSLKELIRARGRLPVTIALSVGKQLARALEIAHEQGVIHRDIKPQNMVVQADGVLKVMDFGIARLASRQPESGVTQAGMIIGTPEYMAPEQLSGAEVDHRVDLYAAGCVLYECLTGRPPITADTPYQLVARLLEDTPAAPRTINPDVPAALEALVMSALAKDPAQRPPSALAFYERLAAIG